MSDTTDGSPLEMADEDSWADLPLVDFLWFDAARDTYVITIIPTDSTSSAEKEVVEVARRAVAGARIGKLIEEIGRSLGGVEVDRVFHAGGAEFGFYLSDGTLLEPAKQTPFRAASKHLRAALSDLAKTAETEFLAARTAASRTI